MGYLVTFPLFCLGLLTKFFPPLSQKINLAAEYVQCFSIRFLLKIQPWLNCDSNFQNIYGFFDQYRTRKVMFIANHRSNLDTFLLISLIPGLRGLAKKTLFYNIFFAPIMVVAGFIPIEKGDINGFVNGLKFMQNKLLKKNNSVLVFPETTRCEKNFLSINKFSKAVFETAIQSSAVVVPIFIGGSDQVMGRGDLLLNPYNKITLKILNPIVTTQTDSAVTLSKQVWTHLNDELMEHTSCS